MELRTLGGLVLTPAAFSRPKPMLLLAYLALEGAQDRRFLAELFWPHASDRLKSLGVALARLRKGAPGAVEADQTRVWTRVECDAVRFLTHLEQGDVDGASALYGGPFLDGLHLSEWSAELEEWVYDTREFLAARLRGPLLDRAARAAEDGRFEEAADDAEQAYRVPGAPPLDPEELARVHDLLHATHHPLAAKLRGEVRELGVEVAGSPAAARARFTGDDRDQPTPQVQAHNLPVPATSFVGRAQDVGEVARTMAEAEHRLLTLLGPAGVGKTRLALQAAYDPRARARYRDGIHLISLEPAGDANAMVTTVGEALGIDLVGTSEPLARIGAAIRDRRLLLVLDNVEHVADGARELATLVGSCPALTLLVTSRQRLGLAEERVVRVDGLRPPPAHHLSPREAMRFDAVRLFVQRATRVRPDFVLSEENVADVIRICHMVEGLPLGLELAAAWVRVMPPGDIAAEIAHDMDLLSSHARDALPRHQSIRVAFEQSWRLLEPREARVLRQLAVFQAGFRREAARAVPGASITVLAALVDKSLLRVDRAGRYDRHPLLYHYTAEKLQERPDELAEVGRRHRAYFLERMRAWGAELRGNAPRQVLDEIEQELENVRAAWTNALADPGEQELAGALDPLTEFFDARQRFHDGLDLITRVIDGAAAGQEGLRGRALAGKARLLRRLGRYDDAREHAQRAVQLARSVSDPKGATRGLRELGATALHLGAYGEAEEHVHRALALARESEDPLELGRCLGSLGLVHTLTGAYQTAEAHLEEALRHSRACNDPFRLVMQLNTLGLLFDDRGDPARARRHWEEALQRAQELGDRQMQLKLLVNLGLVAHKEGDHDQAQTFNHEALRRAREAGESMLEAVILAKLGWIRLAQNDAASAERYLVRALEATLELQEVPRALEALGGLAEVRVQQRRPSEAAQLLSVVEHHPLARTYLRDEARRWLDILREDLSPEAWGEAHAWGRGAHLDVVVSGVARGVGGGSPEHDENPA